MDILARHQCVIYEGSPAEHLPGLAALIYGKLKTQHRCLYLDSPKMMDGLRSYLYAAGVDVEREVRTGALVLASDQNHLVNGRFDATKMLRGLVDSVNQALQDGYRGLWASGDMTWEFGSEKNLDMLLDYELRLEELFRQHPQLSGICQYRRDMLPVSAIRDALCTHRALYINQTLARINPYFAPGSMPDLEKLDLSAQLDALISDLGERTD
jgi:hypothetical protein